MKIKMSMARCASMILCAIAPSVAWAVDDQYCWNETENGSRYREPMIASIPSMSPPSFSPSVPVGTVLNGVLEIPLSARYIRTGQLRGGTANATATFTMNYQ